VREYPRLAGGDINDFESDPITVRTQFRTVESTDSEAV
jgi:hypothetical protein